VGTVETILSKDFGGYPWSTSKYGGYGVTIPSKFVQPDGKTMYLQAKVCPCGGGIGTSVHNFNLRKLVLTPSSDAPAGNLPGADNLPAPSTGAVAISKSTQSGSLALMNEIGKSPQRVGLRRRGEGCVVVGLRVAVSPQAQQGRVHVWCGVGPGRVLHRASASTGEAERVVG
jgi:hypothetical protein